MRRTIIVPTDPGAPALAELKGWLGIQTSAEDDLLARLLLAALDACEGFTCVMPLVQTCAEIVPVCGRWQRLSARPVSAITQVNGLPAEGSAFALPADAFAIDIDAQSTGVVRVIRPGSAGRAEVRYLAGLASAWADLPGGLRHGCVRLAAHLYRSRDSGENSTVPLAVAALWRPWRRVQLA